MKTVATPPHGFACLQPALQSSARSRLPHTVSPLSLSATDPSLSETGLSVMAPDPSLSGTYPSVMAPDPSLSAQDRPSLSSPLPPLGLGPMKTVTTRPRGLASLQQVTNASTRSRVPHAVSPPSLSAPIDSNIALEFLWKKSGQFEGEILLAHKQHSYGAGLSLGSLYTAEILQLWLIRVILSVSLLDRFCIAV